MVTPLLTLVPLLLNTAAAAPPVQTGRVTGNVSTEHHTRRAQPVTDACRVTGNIIGGVKSPQSCRLHADFAAAAAEGEFIAQRAQVDFILDRAYYTQEGEQCHAEGSLVSTRLGTVCRLAPLDGATPTPETPTSLVPAPFIAREPGT